MPEAMIKVKNLKKNYRNVEALKSISFEVQKGSVFGFIGRNGAGKTTTMNILAGLIGFDEGKIYIKGKDLLRKKAALKNVIGYLPETPAFYDYMNAYEYLTFIGSILEVDLHLMQEKIDKLRKMVHLTKKQASRRISGYSRGMKQRLALAAAFIKRPEILLLDEPASALDPEGRLEMLELIEGLKNEDITIFLSTHILNDAERVCDRICIIDEGNILINKELEELKKEYIQPIFDIEFEKDPSAQVDTLIKTGWIENVRASGRMLSIYPKDIKTARKNMLGLINEIKEDNEVLSYYIRKSTLEDIFIRMVRQNNANGSIKG
jgi:ABC-2 type transport system ATP-binding protein